jgi:hypothetical protein
MSAGEIGLIGILLVVLLVVLKAGANARWRRRNQDPFL